MTTLFGYFIGFVIRWSFFAYAWPFVGPYVLDPCPMFTRAGAVVWALVGGLMHIGDRYNNDDRYLRKTAAR